MKNILIWISIALVLAQAVCAGVTNPLPTELNLLKGESGRFKFQIQTIASNQELECNYSLAESSPLTVEFDTDNVIVPAGSVREVRGTVTIPKELGFGSYEEKFCISCRPTQGAEGASVHIDTCDLPIKVNVVPERTRENMYIPLKEENPLIGKAMIVAGIIIIVAILTAILIYYCLKKRRMAKKEG